MPYQFKDIEFKDMMYNPAKIPEGKSVFVVYKELSKYVELTRLTRPKIDNEMLMKYIMCMYDQNTPYRSKYPDVLKRKIEVAKDVGFKLNSDGTFQKMIEQMLKGKNEYVNAKITTYLRIHRSFKYSYFTTLESAYYNQLNNIMSGDATTKQISELKKMQVELEGLMVEMLNDDDNKYQQDNLLRYVEEERLSLRPEDIAIKLANDEQPISD